MNLKNLQNGSDIRGVSLQMPGEAKPNLTPAEAMLLGAGFTAWLSKKTGKSPKDLKVAIGMDPRLTGPDLFDGLAKGMNEVSVLDCGLASTPAMFMSTVFEGVATDGAVMITASHLPMNRNGFKFFSKEGGLNKEDISAIIDFAEDVVPNPNSCPKIAKYDLMSVYCEHLKKIIINGVDAQKNPNTPLAGLKIVVDAGNGAAGFYANRILEPLGADISESQFLSPDGRFPNHAPNPENAEAMKSIGEKVLSSGADLGLIFDTDVDRSAAVDKYGNEIARNGIVALAASLIADTHPGSTVVTDSITGNQLHDFLTKNLGLKHLRYKRGYRNVINKAVELNNRGIPCALAIETSGHAALSENYFLDDGAYLATKIVIKAAQLKKLGKTIDSLIEDLEAPKEAKEVRMNISREDFADYGEKILSDMLDWIKQGPCTESNPCTQSNPCRCGMSLEEPNYEGIRINFDNEGATGWCLLRKSLHDPLLALNIESDEVGGVDKIAQKLKAFLEKYEALNTTDL